MTHRPRIPHTTRGPEAVTAVLDDLELSTHVDLPAHELTGERFYRLSSLDERVAESARRAAAADTITPDEVIEDLAAEVGRDSPYDDGEFDTAYDR